MLIVKFSNQPTNTKHLTQGVLNSF